MQVLEQEEVLTVEDYKKKEEDLLIAAGNHDRSQKAIVIELANTMSKRFELEARSESELKYLKSTICSTIRQLYEDNHVSYSVSVKWALKKYPQYKRSYEQDEGSLMEKVTTCSKGDLVDFYITAVKEEQQALESYNERDRILKRIEKRAAKDGIALPSIETKKKGQRISILYRDPEETELTEAVETAIESLQIMKFELMRNPPESYIVDSLKKGFLELARFYHPLEDHKHGVDPLSWLRIFRRLKEEGNAPAADDDPIMVNICAKCSSNVVKNPNDYVLMEFHEEVEVRAHNGSLIEVLENIWQCPECKGFERMRTGMSMEHVSNRTDFIIHLAEDFLASVPEMLVSIRAWKHSVRSQIGLRKLRTVSIFEEA